MRLLLCFVVLLPACLGGDDQECADCTYAFERLTLSSGIACGTMASEGALCWDLFYGIPTDGDTPPPNLLPEGSWRDAIAAARPCAIPATDGFECWNWTGEEHALVFREEGEFATLWGRGDQVCALGEDGLPSCRESDQPLESPNTAFVRMDTGGAYCGIGANDNEISCWTYDWTSEDHPVLLMPNPLPGVGVSAIAIDGLSYAPLEVPSGCAIREDDSTLACWGAPATGVPSGRFVTVDMRGGVTCALDEDGAPHCWASPAVFPATCLAQAVEVDETLTDIVVDSDQICGLDDAGSPLCWQCAEDD